MKRIAGKLILGALAIILIVAMVMPDVVTSWLSALEQPAETTDPTSTASSTSESTPELPPESTADPITLVSLDDEVLAEHYLNYVYGDNDATKEEAAAEGDFTKALKAGLDANPEDPNGVFMMVYSSNRGMRRYVTGNVSELLKQDIPVDAKVLPHLGKEILITPGYRSWFAQQESIFRQSAEGKLIPQGVKYALNGMGYIDEAGNLSFNPFDPNKEYKALEIILEFVDYGIFVRMVFVTECGNPAVPYNPPNVEKPPKPAPEKPKPAMIPLIVKKVATGDRDYPDDVRFPISTEWKPDGKKRKTTEVSLRPGEEEIIDYVDPKLFSKDSVGVDERLSQKLKSDGWTEDGFEVVLYKDAIYIYVYNRYESDGGGGRKPPPGRVEVPKDPSKGSSEQGNAQTGGGENENGGDGTFQEDATEPPGAYTPPPTEPATSATEPPAEESTDPPEQTIESPTLSSPPPNPTDVSPPGDSVISGTVSS